MWGGEETPSGSLGSVHPAPAPDVSSCLGGCESGGGFCSPVRRRGRLMALLRCDGGVMVRLFLLWSFVGRCCPLLVEVPTDPVAVAPGGTALLRAALRLPAPLPPFFQVRWRFLPTGRLVLLLAAQGCSGVAPWRESCHLGLERGRGYEGRADLGPQEASLLLQNTCAEDAGTYRISLLGLDVQVSAELNLTLAPTADADPTSLPPPTSDVPMNSSSEQQEGTEPPVTLVRATEDGQEVVVSNAVRLGLAGLVFCLLVLIVGEYILSARNKDIPETDSPLDAAATNATLSKIYVLKQMSIPDGSEELTIF